MVHLEKLPNELKVLVAEYLGVWELWAFARVCRTLWRCCEGLLKQQQKLSEEWKVANPDKIWDFLDEVTYNNPDIAYHVRDFISSEQCGGSRSTEQVERFRKLFEEERLDAYRNEDLWPLWWPNVDWLGEEEARQEMTGRRYPPLVLMAVTRLPHLRRLEISDGDHNEYVFGLIEAVGKAYADPNRTIFLPFENLTTAAIYHSGNEGFLRWEYVRYFCHFPAMKTISGYKIGGNLYPQGLRARRGVLDMEPFQTNVRLLELNYSSVGLEAIHNILSVTGALQGFCYDCGGSTVSDNTVAGQESFEPKGMLGLLLKSCTQSLEVLQIENTGGGSTERGEGGFRRPKVPHLSLKRFQKLKTVHLDWDGLVPDLDDSDFDSDGEDNDDPEVYKSSALLKLTDILDERDRIPAPIQNLAEILPTSLECLQLEDCPEYGVPLVVKMLETKDQFLPNLQKVFVCIRGEVDSLTEQVTKAAEKASVAFIDQEPPMLLERMDWGPWRV